MLRAFLFLSFVISFATEAQSAYVPGEILVRYKREPAPSVLMNITDEKILKLSGRQLHILKLASPLFGNNDSALFNKIADLKKDPNVVYAEPNYILQMHDQIPNDPEFPRQWGFVNDGYNDPVADSSLSGIDVNALRAWGLQLGSRAVKIAVVDSGVDVNHPDLKENIWTNQAELKGKPGVDDDGNGFIDDIHGYNFIEKNGDVSDVNGHGTHCAGTIGAVHNNNEGIAGVMAHVSLVPLKILDKSGFGDTAAAVAAIDYATQMNVDVISNSWGMPTYSEALSEAVRAASDKGIVFVASAGNQSNNLEKVDTYPANLEWPNVISVAALTSQNQLANYSNYGKNKVHIAAPGSNILSTAPGGKYVVNSGTSMAAPFVSGAVGLLIAQNGRMNLSGLRERVVMTAETVPGFEYKVLSGGRLDLYNLLTDTRHGLSGPKPFAWVSVPAQEAWESPHPYVSDTREVKTFRVPGAQYLRVRIKKLQLEYSDFLTFYNAKGEAVGQVSGSARDVFSEHVVGDTITVEFTTDSRVNSWGFVIENLEAQF